MTTNQQIAKELAAMYLSMTDPEKQYERQLKIRQLKQVDYKRNRVGL